MRRLLTLASLLALALVALAVGSGAQGSSTARFDVIFDDAHGLVSGQVVKVAGAQVGKIVNIVLTPDFKARIEAEVDSGFMPFRANATCTIRPEGLISENYLECDPGRPPAPILRGGGGHPPTVPVSNVTEPVSLTDLFNIFNVPTQERFTVLLDELGMATAGAGAGSQRHPAAGQPDAQPGPSDDRDPGPPARTAGRAGRCHEHHRRRRSGAHRGAAELHHPRGRRLRGHRRAPPLPVVGRGPPARSAGGRPADPSGA